MTNKEIAIKYTDEHYATKTELSILIQSNFIEPFWKHIVEYRNNYKKVLSLYDYTKTPYYIVFTEQVSAKIKSIMTSFSNLTMKLSNISPNSPEALAIRNEMYARILRCVAKNNNLNPSDVTIANIISHRAVPEDFNLLVNYFNCLTRLGNNLSNPVTVDSIGEYYATIQGVDELTSFYRDFEFNLRNAKFVIGRDNTIAPASSIDALMDNAIDFLKHSTLDYYVRAFVGFFVMNQVRPFAKYNEELSILIFKNILGKYSFDKLITFIPFEELLINESKGFSKAFVESTKEKDLTYFLIAFNELTEKIFTYVSQRLDTIISTTALSAFYGDDEPEVENLELEEEQPKVVEPVQQPKQVVSKPHIKKEQPVKPAPKAVVVSAPKVVSSTDYDALAEDLLESDPFLRPAQAAFYVRHCTIGKYYTIAQYKKATGCVYETARTSMDNLAKRGYYKREGLKNKFIYTPIPKE